MILPWSMKLLTKELPQVEEMASLTSASDSPSAPSFSLSMSSLNCGVSSWPFGRTAVRAGFLAAMASNWLRASSSLSCPTPPLSWSSKSKPVALPSSRTAGGMKAKAMASRNFEKAAIALPTTAFALKSGALPQVPVLELDEGEPHVLPAAGEAEARDRKEAVYRILLLHEVVVFELL